MEILMYVLIVGWVVLMISIFFMLEKIARKYRIREAVLNISCYVVFMILSYAFLNMLFNSFMYLV